ncbi:ABC transporter substrate-binding protein [Kiloniella sp. EL199]|uniref:substrate-binding periplasmic protein n=1 Tax=Kiloniella sp. EL199 TaxID=2107581 RepID=UPI0020B16790|nr:transporter substrate-binding domain-containing protein [Kiloniella sp. EL199]
MIKRLLLCWFFPFLAIGNVSATELYTEDFPPYNYLENNELKGIGPKIVRELAREVGEEPKITVLPWARAYKYAQEMPDVGIFSIVRTPKREDVFQWVGPLYTVRVGLYAAKENKHLYQGTNEENLEQARKVGDIAVQLGGAGEELLTTLRFQNLNKIVNINKSLFLLLKGRYDLLETSDVFMAYMAKEDGVSEETVSEAAFIGNYEMYLAFSKSTPIETVQKWREALSRMRKIQSTEDIQIN